MKQNKPLEKWWSQLSEGKSILIYKGYDDDSIVDVLTSARSHDAYDVLYSKAKDGK